MSVHQYLHSHPFLGAILASVSLFSGYVIPSTLDVYHVPEVIMQSVQLLAWGSTVVVAYFTVKKKK